MPLQIPIPTRKRVLSYIKTPPSWFKQNFNPLLSAWVSEETLFLVFDIFHQTQGRLLHQIVASDIEVVEKKRRSRAVFFNQLRKEFGYQKVETVESKSGFLRRLRFFVLLFLFCFVCLFVFNL